MAVNGDKKPNSKEKIMGGTGALLFFAAIGIIGIAVWGLFKKELFIVHAIAGVLLIPVASLGAWYSWIESNSASFTMFYSGLAIIGLVTAYRFAKQKIKLNSVA